MGAVSPRWEWRAFAQDFGTIETHLRRDATERRQSSETYLVSAHRADINTKIRDGLLDIKVLQEINPHHLELWQPVLKAAFPLTQASLGTMFGAWGLEPPFAGDLPVTESRLLDTLIRPEPSLAIVIVDKTRYGSIVDECLVEFAQVTFNGSPLKTIAVEMTDPDRVWRTVAALGLSTFENVNYVRALMRFLGASHPDVCATAPGRARL